MPTEFVTAIPVTLLLKDGSSGEKVINAIKPNTVKASATTPKKSLINIGTVFSSLMGHNSRVGLSYQSMRGVLENVITLPVFIIFIGAVEVVVQTPAFFSGHGSLND